MNTTAAQDMQEMMNGWNTIFAAARREFPTASEEEIYQIAKDAMAHTLNIK